MRERLALVGGQLLAAEPTASGFRVHATIPLEPAEVRAAAAEAAR